MDVIRSTEPICWGVQDTTGREIAKSDQKPPHSWTLLTKPVVTFQTYEQSLKTTILNPTGDPEGIVTVTREWYRTTGRGSSSEHLSMRRISNYVTAVMHAHGTRLSQKHQRVSEQVGMAPILYRERSHSAS